MTYDNQSKSTVTYEYGDGNCSTFESYGNWSKQVIQCLGSHIKNGGEGGIRTHGTLARSPVFKTGAFDHSAYFTVLL